MVKKQTNLHISIMNLFKKSIYKSNKPLHIVLRDGYPKR